MKPIAPALDQEIVSPDLPVLPLDVDSDAYAIGKTVISMGYPSGPDRLLAMLEDSIARLRPPEGLTPVRGAPIY